jgi:hypothetical protein
MKLLNTMQIRFNADLRFPSLTGEIGEIVVLKGL